MTLEILFFVGSILFCKGFPVEEPNGRLTTYVKNEETIPSQASSLENELKQLHHAYDVSKVQSPENLNQVLENSKNKAVSNLSSKEYSEASEESALHNIPSDITTKNQEYKDFGDSQEHIQGTEKTKAVLQAVNHKLISLTTTVTSDPQPKSEETVELVQPSITEENENMATISPAAAAEEAPEVLDNSLDETEKREVGENRVNLDKGDRIMSKGDALVDEKLMEFMVKLAEHPKLWTRVREMFDKVGEERAPVWIEGQYQTPQSTMQKSTNNENSETDSDPNENHQLIEKSDGIINTEFTTKNKKQNEDQIISAVASNVKSHDSAEDQSAIDLITVVPDEHDSHEVIPQVFTDTPSPSLANQPEPTTNSQSNEKDNFIEHHHEHVMESENDLPNDKSIEDDVINQHEFLYTINASAIFTSQQIETSQNEAVTTSSIETQQDNRSEDKGEIVEKELKAVANEGYQSGSNGQTQGPNLKDEKYEDLEDVEEQLTALKKNKSLENKNNFADHLFNSNMRNM